MQRLFVFFLCLVPRFSAFQLSSKRLQLTSKIFCKEPSSDSPTIEDTDVSRQVTTVEKISPSTYFFGKDDEFQNDMKKLNIDPIRFVSFSSLALVIALGVKSSGVDQIFAVDGLKRYVSSTDDNSPKYEYLYPSTWLADQTVLMAKIRLNETPAALRTKLQAKALQLPDSAYGPAGGNGRLNLSCIKNKVLSGFTLKGTLGSPSEAAQNLLSRSIAPEGSGKTTQLITSYEDVRNGQSAYVFEYTVQKGESYFQHAISVIMSSDNTLYTFTAVAPEREWDSYGEVISKAAKSFSLSS